LPVTGTDVEEKSISLGVSSPDVPDPFKERGLLESG
jgi:hypothetical protein